MPPSIPLIKAKKRRPTQTSRSEASPSAPVQREAEQSSTLTFVTDDGERIVFDGMGIPIEQAAALVGEDALGKIWNRPAEDAAWRDM